MTRLDEWNLRISAMDMNLMYSQLREKAYTQLFESKDGWLDTAAHAIVAMFEQESAEHDGAREGGGGGEEEKKTAFLKFFWQVRVLLIIRCTRCYFLSYISNIFVFS